MANKPLHPTKLFKTLIIIATALSMGVVMLGAYTRLTNAGLGCPDWPGCYGHIGVPHSSIATAIHPDLPFEASKAWTEMVHRYFASTLGLIIAIIFTLAWRQRRNPQYPKLLPISLFCLVILQGMLGMWTVTLKLHPTIVMLHLIGGFTTLAILWSTLLQVSSIPKINLTDQKKFRLLASLGLVFLILQIMLGGWTSANYAAVICPDFPFCQGKLLPPLDFNTAFNLFQPVGPNFAGGLFENTARVTVHMSHRFGAIATAIVLSLLFIKLLLQAQQPHLRKVTIVIGVLLTTQLVLGVANIMFLLPLPIAVAHNGVAALLLLSLVSLNIFLWQRQAIEAK